MLIKSVNIVKLDETFKFCSHFPESQGKNKGMNIG